MKLFSRTEPLEFAAMDLLGSLKMTAQEKNFMLVRSDRFKKMERCIPLCSTAASSAAAAILEY